MRISIPNFNWQIKFHVFPDLDKQEIGRDIELRKLWERFDLVIPILVLQTYGGISCYLDQFL